MKRLGRFWEQLNLCPSKVYTLTRQQLTSVGRVKHTQGCESERNSYHQFGDRQAGLCAGVSDEAPYGCPCSDRPLTE